MIIMICSVFFVAFVLFCVFFIVSEVLSFMCFYCAMLSAVSLWRINLSFHGSKIITLTNKQTHTKDTTENDTIFGRVGGKEYYNEIQHLSHCRKPLTR